MSGLEVQSVLRKMVAMRKDVGHWTLGAGFEFQELYTVLEKVHDKVMHAEPLVDSRSSAAYFLFVADLRRAALRVDDMLDKFSYRSSVSLRAEKFAGYLSVMYVAAAGAAASIQLLASPLGGLVVVVGCLGLRMHRRRPQQEQNNKKFAGHRGKPMAEAIVAWMLRPKIVKQFTKVHMDLQLLLRLFSTYVSELLPEQPLQNDSDVFQQETFPPAKKPSLVGRDQDKQHVLNVIRDGHTNLVVIVGMAGVGKTEFAADVYWDAEGFDYLMWVYVSQDFSPERIIRSVMNSFSNESSWFSMKQGLVDKKYLLVLDDVWNEDARKWNQLLILLSTKKPDSKIIVTTRIRGVAAAASAAAATVAAAATLPGTEAAAAAASAAAAAARAAEDGRATAAEVAAAAASANEAAAASADAATAADEEVAAEGAMAAASAAEVAATAASASADAGRRAAAAAEAAAAIRSARTHMLPSLSDQDSLNLLNVDSTSSIVERCSGLPKLLDFLKSSEENIGSVEEFDSRCMNDSGLLLAARASYDHLPSRLQRCFLHCSLFPLDHIFEAEELTYLFVAEGLTQISTRYEPVDEGLSKLLDECFQVLDKSGSRGQMRYKMQYILHNFAQKEGENLYKIENCSSLSEHSTRYMSLMVDDTTLKLPMSLIEQEDLRTLILLRKQEMVLSCRRSKITEIPSEYCRYLRTLRVLDLHATRIEMLPDRFDMMSNLRYLNLSETDIAELPGSFHKFQYLIYLNIAQTRISAVPESVGGINSLRYLNLSQTAVTKLPESIGHLRMLQTLQLSHCRKLVKLPDRIASLTSLQKLDLEGCHYLSEMPRDIRKMKNLKELNIIDCTYLDKMPRGLSALTKMEALPWFMATSGANKPIKELQYLKNIKILGLENIKKMSVKVAQCIRLSEKNKLQHLRLHFSMDTEDTWDEKMEELLTCLKPSQELKTLEIISFAGKCFPPWMSSNGLQLKKLTEIKLINMKCGSLPPLGQLPLLATVEISGMNDIKHVSKDLNGIGTFRSLKKLTFSQMLNLESWPADNGGATCPYLAELSIIQCPKFQKLSMKLPAVEKLTVWMSPRELLGEEGLAGVASSLKSMSISLCEKLSSSDFEGLSTLSKLDELEISGCDELESLPHRRKLPQLERLSVSGCRKLHDLTNLSQYKTLKSLRISGCPSVQSIPKNLRRITTIE